jgi:hypothetical protein
LIPEDSPVRRVRKNLPKNLRKLVALGTLAATAVCAAGGTAARPAPSDAPTVLDSQITLGTDYPAMANRSFASTPVMQLKRGTVLPSRALIGRLGMDRMVSVRRYNFEIGARTVAYPVVGLMRCSNFSDTGSFVKVIASRTVVRVDAGGQPVHSGAFAIEAARVIKAGESIPTVRVNFQDKNFIFSIEEAPKAATQPMLSIVPIHASAREREVALEAWRLSNQTVREGMLQ